MVGHSQRIYQAKQAYLPGVWVAGVASRASGPIVTRPIVTPPIVTPPIVTRPDQDGLGRRVSGSRALVGSSAGV
jgi:hypothetical protein